MEHKVFDNWDSIKENEKQYENEAMVCYLNNENKRNSEALIQKTFLNGRHSRDSKYCHNCKKIGTWFCHLK